MVIMNDTECSGCSPASSSWARRFGGRRAVGRHAGGRDDWKMRAEVLT